MFAATLAGFILGAFFLNPRSGFVGAIIGGCLGYTLHAISELNARVDALKQDMELLRLQTVQAPTQEPQDDGFKRPAPRSWTMGQVEPASAQSTRREESPHEPSVSPATPPPQPIKPMTPPPEPTQPTMAEVPFTEPSQPTRPIPQRAAHAEPAAEPAEERILPEWMSRLFSGENLLVKLGVIILFLGVSFLVMYAAQHGMFPLQLRLLAVATGGFGLLEIGWRVRRQRPVYAQVMQGGGVAILYLTTFAAMRIYHLIPTAVGFVLMIVICTFTVLLAVWQDASPMAFFGTAGAFVVPELAGIGSGNHVTLFSYYALLNAGIFAIAWFRSWRGLNVLGFVSTFIVSALWGARFYRPSYFDTVEPFLIIFFLCYTAIPILFARRERTNGVGHLDGTLVFGTPIAAFALQAALVQGFQYGLAWSALALAVFYACLALILFRTSPDVMEPFCDVFLSFGVVFATLAVPLAFDARWTAAAWSVEGAGLVWAGVRQERTLARAFGYLMLFASGASFMTGAAIPTGSWPVLNGFYCGCLMVSGSAIYSAHLLFDKSQRIEAWETLLEKVLFMWGITWWFFSGLNEVRVHTSSHYADGAGLAFIALSCAACAWLRPRLSWPLLDLPSLGLLPAMWIYACYFHLSGAAHPAAHGGYLAWPLAFGVWFLTLKRNEERGSLPPAGAHAASLWLITLLSSWEVYWQVAHLHPRLATWAALAWGVIPALISLLVSRRGERMPWPVSRHYQDYLLLGTGPVVMSGWIWCVAANLTMAGDFWPLSYIPILNPLDGATIVVLLAIAGWYLAVREEFPFRLPQLESYAAYGATVFLCLNATLLRTIHYWCGVPFNAHALFGSMLVQAALSILWSVTALAAMTVAARRGLRALWIAGATLLGTVTLKLFLIDLANRGSIERIVSFVAVGILLLVIGWFAPVPPRND